MEFLLDVVSFALKVLAIAIAVAIVASLLIAQMRRRTASPFGQLRIVSLNDHYQYLYMNLRQALLTKKAFKAEKKAEKKSPSKPKEKRIFVLDFKGDLAATSVADLREQVSAIITIATPDDEVVLRLESPGGIVSNYGLAASQLVRLREAGIPLTACVDQVAASGGYMMACVANQIFAAPFAIVGSIGILAMVPNFHRLLKKFDVDYFEMTAGEYKTTLTPMGEVTEKGLAKFKEDMEDAHQLFKTFIKQYRGQLDVDAIATGEHWFGQNAVANHLIDRVTTSDDYLLSQRQTADIYRIEYIAPKSVRDRVTHMFSEAADHVLIRWVSRLFHPRGFHF